MAEQGGGTKDDDPTESKASSAPGGMRITNEEITGRNHKGHEGHKGEVEETWERVGFFAILSTRRPSNSDP